MRDETNRDIGICNSYEEKLILACEIYPDYEDLWARCFTK